MSDSVRPHWQQPTRLCPWDSPGKNTGVCCHFLLQCMRVKSENEVAEPCLTLRDPMDCSLPSSSIHGIFQARVLEWGAIAFSDILKLIRPNFPALSPNPPHFQITVFTDSILLVVFLLVLWCHDLGLIFYSCWFIYPSQSSHNHVFPLICLSYPFSPLCGLGHVLVHWSCCKKIL